MSPISITKPTPRTEQASSWEKFGLLENPFPQSGIGRASYYDKHQPLIGPQINEWLSNSVGANISRWAPLAISGSIGVGKTHLLSLMEQACVAYRESEKLGPRLMVSRHTLTGSGMKTLLLSDILLESLNQPFPAHYGQNGSPSLPLLSMAIQEARGTFGLDVAEILRVPSPIARPLDRIVKETDDAAVAVLEGLLSSWLSRRNLSSGQMSYLGVSGKLDGEGQAVRAISHICTFARSVMNFRVWVIMIDQLEDLWRRDLTSPLRRTRFLTDLRTLVDESLEGSPIALTLAWNTDVISSASRGEEDVQDRLRHDYLALFSRVRTVVNIPFLPRTHALQFANTYIGDGHARYLTQAGRKTKDDSSKKLFQRLSTEFDAVVSAVPSYGQREDGSLVARAWLDTLRSWADKIALEIAA